jgi:hypothetical protein
MGAGTPYNPQSYGSPQAVFPAAGATGYNNWQDLSTNPSAGGANTYMPDTTGYVGTPDYSSPDFGITNAGGADVYGGGMSGYGGGTGNYGGYEQIGMPTPDALQYATITGDTNIPSGGFYGGGFYGG